MRSWKKILLSALPMLALAVEYDFAGGRLFAQQPGAPTSNSNEPVVPVTAHRTDIELVEKFAKVLETKNRIVRVDGFDEKVLSVSALTPNRVRISGLMQGVTSLVFYDESGGNFTVDVFIKGDARQLQAIIDKKFPNSSIEAFKVQDAIALRGWVTQSEQITQIVEIAEQFYPKVLNQMRVGGVQQVLLKVRVMEAQRSLIRQLGINFTYVGRGGYATSNPGAISATGIGSATGSTLPFGGPPTVATAANSLLTNASIGVVNNNSSLQSFLSSLRDESLVKILAEPEVVALNGRPATLLSGGEFPIIVPQSLGTVSIQYREFGVRVEATPIVLGSGNLRLELQPEVSDRDDAHGVTINGTTVPALTVRRVNTQVEMKFGQTLMLAGLISNTQRASLRKIPFLGELPYIGAAFSQKQYTDAETEIVITVTPELVAPLDEGQVPPGGPGQSTDTPTDRELMGYGLSEVPKYGDRCPPTASGPAGPYVVPGLKEFPKSAPAAAADKNQLILPSPQSGADQSARSRSSSASVANRKADSSGVRQTGFNDNSTDSGNTRSGTSESRKSVRAPQPSTRKSAASSSRASDKSANNSTSNRKPGLIEPSAR